MFTVYLLQSNKNRHYIGFTSNLSQRISQHNHKHHGTTYGIGEVWEVVASKEFSSKEEAMTFELYLKSLKNWRKAFEALK
jgi:putative endonuclease